MSENPNNVTAPVNNTAPVSQLRTNRGLAKFIIHLRRDERRMQPL